LEDGVDVFEESVSKHPVRVVDLPRLAFVKSTLVSIPTTTTTTTALIEVELEDSADTNLTRLVIGIRAEVHVVVADGPGVRPERDGGGQCC